MTGLEPFVAAATPVLTTLATDILKAHGSNVITRWLNQDIGKATQQAYFDASKKYVESYAERHCSLKVLGMREPVSLESVYTTVQVLEGEDRTFASVEDMERAYREARTRRFRSTKDSKKDGLEIALAKPYLMVLGAPGSGKSTFLRKMGLEALKGKKGGFKKHPCIPVLLELKRLTEPKIDLKKLITNEFQICGFPKAEQFTHKALEQGKLLILLDGLDEVPSVNRDNVIETIQDFVDQYDKNRYITSCRTAVSRRNLRRFTDVTVAEFDDSQIQQFIHNWFQSTVDRESGTADRCWEIMQRSENAAAKELAHTPLLLTFLCLVYDRSQTFSNNRATLYRKALRILLEEWAAEKRIMHQEIYQGLNTELEEVLLSEIAAGSFNADRLFLSQAELVNQIKTFLASNLNAPKHLSGEAVLDAIAVQQGILVERAEDVYSFSHLTLQEYLTARYIVDHRRIEPLVLEHIGDSRWWEVFLLVSGSMVSGNGADELLQAMNQTIQISVAGSPAFQALLQWTYRMTAPDVDGRKGVTKRVAVLAFALAFAHALDLARDRARDLARDRALALALARTFDFALDHDHDHDHDLASTLAFARDLNLARDLACDFTLNLDHDLAHALDLARARARDLALAPTSLFVGVDFAHFAEQMELLCSSVSVREAKYKDWQQFLASLLQLYTDTFKLDPNLIRLIQEEPQTIDYYSYMISSYFYMNSLMVQCQQEAGRVSPQVWESILATMLLPASTELGGNSGTGEGSDRN